jgi:RNA polymerase sigma factor (sigma-70 family)
MSPVAREGESEAELMRQVAAGQVGGLETLYDRYHAVAYALALRITAETGLAEDVVQDSFLGLWRNAGRYAEEKGSVKGWLLAIVRHRAIDSMRRRRNGVAIADETQEPLPAALTLPDVWPEVAGHLDAEGIRRAMGKLPEAQRQVIELAYFEGLTQTEIAARTKAPLGTVKSRMRLGLVALRRELTELGGPAGVGGRIQ